jgi:integrase
VSANSTISATIDTEAVTTQKVNLIDPVLTAVQTITPKKRKSKRFQRVGNGLFRFKRTGGIYGAFKVEGRTRWKCLGTDDMEVGRQRLAEEIKKSSRIDWRQAATVTISQLMERYEQNSMGLAPSTLKIRVNLLDVFKRTWRFGLGLRASEVKPFMLKEWLATRRQDQSLKAAGLNNYIRLLHGLFGLALDLESVAENPAAKLKLLKEESPQRLTPTWQQAQAIIKQAHRQTSKDTLSAMLFLGLGQGELHNLKGEHFDLEKKTITVRRQKTQKIFVIPIYPQAVALVKQLKEQGRLAPGKSVFDHPNPREALSLACKHLDLPQFSPRSFRRAFIIRALEKGIDPRVVAAWQGHRDATLILRVYGAWVNQDHARRMTEF